ASGEARAGGWKVAQKALATLRITAEVLHERGATLAAIAAASTVFGILSDDRETVRILERIHDAVLGQAPRALRSQAPAPAVPRGSLDGLDLEALIDRVSAVTVSSPSSPAAPALDAVPLFPALSRTLFIALVQGIEFRRLK